MDKSRITVEIDVSISPETAWRIWNDPAHIIAWYYASDDWHTPRAENDLRPGGKFNYRMEAKDGSFGFDYWGIYHEIEEQKALSIMLGDGRKVLISFKPRAGHTLIIEEFEAETENSIEMQRRGWQAILDNFKKYAEAQA